MLKCCHIINFTCYKILKMSEKTDFKRPNITSSEHLKTWSFDKKTSLLKWDSNEGETLGYSVTEIKLLSSEEFDFKAVFDFYH